MPQVFQKVAKSQDFFFHSCTIFNKSKMPSYHSDLNCPITIGNSKMVKNRRLENTIFFNKRQCLRSPLAFWKRCCRLFSDAAWTVFQFNPIFALKEKLSYYSCCSFFLFQKVAKSHRLFHFCTIFKKSESKRPYVFETMLQSVDFFLVLSGRQCQFKPTFIKRKVAIFSKVSKSQYFFPHFITCSKHQIGSIQNIQNVVG